MGDDDKTFRLRYTGARFEGTRLPVDVLSDLPAFRDLLVAFAKDQFRRANTDKQRVPKGFDKSLSFDLTAIEDGSAKPVVSWNRNLAQANLPGIADDLERIVEASYRDVVQLIDNAGGSAPKNLSSEHIKALNRLGSGLRDHERIEFEGATGKDGEVVYLDSFRRKALIMRLRRTYQTRLEGTGILRTTHIPADGPGYLRVETADYGLIEIAREPDLIKADFDGNLGSTVQFDIHVELDDKDRLVSIIDVFDVVVIDAQREAGLERCRARLAGFRDLAAGWHDGDGAAVSEAAFTAADRFLSKRPNRVAAYKVFPTLDGGILFEFEQADWDWSVELNASGAVEFYGVEMEGEGELPPQAFPAVDDAFLKLFDKETGRN